MAANKTNEARLTPATADYFISTVPRKVIAILEESPVINISEMDEIEEVVARLHGNTCIMTNMKAVAVAWSRATQFRNDSSEWLKHMDGMGFHGSIRHKMLNIGILLIACGALLDDKGEFVSLKHFEYKPMRQWLTNENGECVSLKHFRTLVGLEFNKLIPLTRLNPTELTELLSTHDVWRMTRDEVRDAVNHILGTAKEKSDKEKPKVKSLDCGNEVKICQYFQSLSEMSGDDFENITQNDLVTSHITAAITINMAKLTGKKIKKGDQLTDDQRHELINNLRSITAELEEDIR